MIILLKGYNYFLKGRYETALSYNKDYLKNYAEKGPYYEEFTYRAQIRIFEIFR
jgi:hypothetical protein